MSFNCETCNRFFRTDEALKQHERDSPAHASSFACKTCKRSFNSEEALEQHVRDSPIHTSSFHCEACDRSFDSQEALQQHGQDSPVHASSFDCETCNRTFNSKEALQQHGRDSPAHASPFNRETSDRAFSSEVVLEQHLQNSPVHTSSFICETCKRSFNSEEALQQHERDSETHQQVAETPLDIFFGSFQFFDYDPSLPPATSYNLLRRQERWQRDDPASSDAWDRYQKALEDEVRMWFGAESDLTAWHSLCHAIGIDPLPRTCEQCEEVRRCHARLSIRILTHSIGCTKDTCQYC
jgi:hypothetical protein